MTCSMLPLRHESNLRRDGKTLTDCLKGVAHDPLGHNEE